MDLLPAVRLPLFVPLHWYCNPFDITPPTEIRRDELTFHLRSYGNDWYHYVCMNAYASCGDESDCSSPNFKPLLDLGSGRKLIPEEIIKWMNDFAKMLMIGAGWGRAKYPVQKMDN